MSDAKRPGVQRGAQRRLTGVLDLGFIRRIPCPTTTSTDGAGDLGADAFDGAEGPPPPPPPPAHAPGPPPSTRPSTHKDALAQSTGHGSSSAGSSGTVVPHTHAHGQTPTSPRMQHSPSQSESSYSSATSSGRGESGSGGGEEAQRDTGTGTGAGAHTHRCRVASYSSYASYNSSGSAEALLTIVAVGLGASAISGGDKSAQQQEYGEPSVRVATSNEDLACRDDYRHPRKICSYQYEFVGFQTNNGAFKCPDPSVSLSEVSPPLQLLIAMANLFSLTTLLDLSLHLHFEVIVQISPKSQSEWSRHPVNHVRF
ncbi:hypothetical protein B0H13DRAFT_2658202 [Mycena leptocephala]|nr:hypothetical protein B0H13DRAFT_2658202 [Mycena leptocephala]